MANVFQIKRSTVTAQPTTLAFGELAYSESSEKLFIGLNNGSVKAIAGDGLGLATANATISVSGDDVSGTGSVAAGISLVLSDTGVTAGEHAVVTVDAKGRVTSGRALAAADVPSLLASKISGRETDRLSAWRVDRLAAASRASTG